MSKFATRLFAVMLCLALLCVPAVAEPVTSPVLGIAYGFYFEGSNSTVRVVDAETGNAWHGVSFSALSKMQKLNKSPFHAAYGQAVVGTPIYTVYVPLLSKNSPVGENFRAFTADDLVYSLTGVKGYSLAVSGAHAGHVTASLVKKKTDAKGSPSAYFIKIDVDKERVGAPTFEILLTFVLTDDTAYMLHFNPNRGFGDPSPASTSYQNQGSLHVYSQNDAFETVRATYPDTASWDILSSNETQRTQVRQYNLSQSGWQFVTEQRLAVVQPPVVADTLVNKAVAQTYPEAKLSFFSANEALLKTTGTMTIPAAPGSYIYRAGDSSALRPFGAAYDAAKGAFVFETNTIGRYVVSDRPLDTTRTAPVPPSYTTTLP